MIVDVTNELKQKVIDEYNYFIKKLFKGYKIDYYPILNKINYIHLSQMGYCNEFMIEYLLNNEIL